jgi:O-antigen/teichoic acid export membrane protein
MLFNKSKVDLILLTSSSLMIPVMGLFFTSLFIHKLSLENFGFYSILLTAIGIISLFDFLRSPYIYLSNKNTFNKAEMLAGTVLVLKKYLNFYILIFIVTIIITSFLFFIYNALFYSYLIFSIIILLPLYVVNSLILASIDATNRTGTTSSLRALSWGGFYLTIFLIISIDKKPEYYVLGFFVMQVVLFLCALFCSKINVVLKQEKSEANINKVYIDLLGLVKKQFKFYSIATLQSSSEKIIILFFLGVSNFGIYSAITETLGKLQFVSRTINIYLLPKLINQSKSYLYRVNFILSTFFCIFFISLTIFFILFKGNVFHDYFDGKLSGYENVLFIILIGVFFKFLGYLSVLQLNAIGDFELQVRAYKLSLYTLPFITILFTYFWGIWGAAIAFVLSRWSEIYMYIKMYENLKVYK